MSYIGKKPVDFNDVTEAQTFTVTGDMTVDTDTLFVDSTNNRVGIGTTSPSTSLDVTGAVTIRDATEPSLRFLDTNAANSDFTIYSPDGSNHLRIKHQSTDRVTVKSSGEVGIGTTPVRQLHLHATSPNNTYLHMTGNATGSTIADGFDIVVTNSTGEAIFIQREAQPISFRTSGTERMSIDSVGSIGIIGASFGLISNGGQSTTTLADDAFINLASHGTATAGGGLLCVYEPSSGDNALYHVGYNRANLISNSGNSNFTTGDVDGKNCVIGDLHTIRFKNRTGSSRGYVFNLFIAGGTSFNQ